MENADDRSPQEGPLGMQSTFPPSAFRMWVRVMLATKEFPFLDLPDLVVVWLTSVRKTLSQEGSLLCVCVSSFCDASCGATMMKYLKIIKNNSFPSFSSSKHRNMTRQRTGTFNKKKKADESKAEKKTFSGTERFCFFLFTLGLPKAPKMLSVNDRQRLWI